MTFFLVLHNVREIESHDNFVLRQFATIIRYILTYVTIVLTIYASAMYALNSLLNGKLKLTTYILYDETNICNLQNKFYFGGKF